jgi:hypothetical protein
VLILHMPVGQPWTIYTLIGIRDVFNGPGAIGTALTISAITPGRLMGRMTAFMFLSTYVMSSNGATCVALIARYCAGGPLAIIPAMQVFFVPIQATAIGLTILAAIGVRRFHRQYGEDEQ